MAVTSTFLKLDFKSEFFQIKMILHNFVSPCCIKCRNKPRCEKHCFPSLILYLLQEILRIYGINVLWKMQRENILSGIFISFLDAHIKSNCQKCVCRVKFLLVKRMTMLKATSLLQPSSFFFFFSFFKSQAQEPAPAAAPPAEAGDLGGRGRQKGAPGPFSAEGAVKQKVELHFF